MSGPAAGGYGGELPFPDEAEVPLTERRDDRSLRRLYDAYRKRQGQALLSLLSGDAIRPLYRDAREWAVDRGIHDGKDPLASLNSYATHILPLPDYSTWIADFRAHRDAHLAEMEGSPQAVGGSEPVTVEIRSFEGRDGGRWYASLNILHARGAWRGFIQFRPASGTEGVRTADIFFGEAPGALRSRFLGFDEQTLKAFLRSALP